MLLMLTFALPCSTRFLNTHYRSQIVFDVITQRQRTILKCYSPAKPFSKSARYPHSQVRGESDPTAFIPRSVLI